MSTAFNAGCSEQARHVSSLRFRFGQFERSLIPFIIWKYYIEDMSVCIGGPRMCTDDTLKLGTDHMHMKALPQHKALVHMSQQ